MTRNLILCLIALFGLIVPHSASGQSYGDPTFYQISWYSCDPSQCWNGLFVPAQLVGDISTSAVAGCGAQNPHEPTAHPYVECHYCALSQELTTGVSQYGQENYDVDIGTFRVDGLRGDGTITDSNSNTWYAGFEEDDCDQGGTLFWPPEQPC